MLPVGSRELAGYLHTDEQRMLLDLPGQDVPFIPGRINWQQLVQHRDSYINALLIQSRGIRMQHPCAACQSTRGRPVFPECRRVPGAYNGCCANCKWRDHASHCTIQDGQILMGGYNQLQGAQMVIDLVPAIGEAENPINLDPEEGEEGNPIVL